MTRIKWFVLTATTAALGVAGVKLYRRHLEVDDEPEEGVLMDLDPFDHFYEDAEMPAYVSSHE